MRATSTAALRGLKGVEWLGHASFRISTRAGIVYIDPYRVDDPSRKQGYRLVGVNQYQYNAFFIKNGLGDDLIPEIPAKDCFGHPKVAWGIRERFPTTKDFPWVEVTPGAAGGVS